MKSDAAYLWSLSAEIAAVIEAWLKEHEGKTIFVRFKRVDMLRLTRLQAWSWRHRIPVDEILTLTLPYLRKSIHTKQKSRFGLGVSIAALTGSGNEKILIEAIKLRYPSGEHRGIWRQAEQMRQLDAERSEDSDGLTLRSPAPAVGILESDSVEAYLKSYRARVGRARDSVRFQQQNPKRRRKSYRGNPWF